VWVSPFVVLAVLFVVIDFFRVCVVSWLTGNSRLPLRHPLQNPLGVACGAVLSGLSHIVSLSPRVSWLLLVLVWVCNTSVLDCHTVHIPFAFSLLSFRIPLPLGMTGMTRIRLRNGT
jgi:hypothetical protein